MLDLTVSDEGRINDVAVVEDDFDGRLDGCVAGSVRDLRLDTEVASTPTIRYPVILSSARPIPRS